MKYSIWTRGWLKALSLGDLFSQLLPQGLSPLQHFLFTSLSPEPKHDVTNGFGVWHLSSVAVTQSLSTFFCDVVVKSLLSDSRGSFGGAADLLTGQPPLQTAKVTTSFPCGPSDFFFFFCGDLIKFRITKQRDSYATDPWERIRESMKTLGLDLADTLNCALDRLHCASWRLAT